MRKNYIHLLLLLLLNVSMFGQKVTISPTLINGMGYSGGSINLGSLPTTTVSLSVKVDVPSSAAAGNQGTIKIYFSRGTALGSNVTNGGDGGALYFGGGNVATRSFVIELNWSDFLTSGGFIYAEYNNGTAYKSSNITVIKNSTVNTGTNLNPPKDAPNPKNITNTICCDQTIRLGEKPEQITGSQYLNPYDTLPYGIASVWETTARSPIIFDNINKTLNIDYITEPGDITIKRNLGYYHNFEPVNKSNTVKIKVLPSPITSNVISIPGYKDSNGFVEITNTNPKTIYSSNRSIGRVNLNILQDPYHVSQRGDVFADIDRYEWEYTKTNAYPAGENNWITITGENSPTIEYFNSLDIDIEKENYFLLRRIAIYKNIRSASNTIKIILRTVKNNNIICCDQILIENPSVNQIENPSVITGATPSIDNQNLENNSYEVSSIAYQWQKQSISDDRPNTYGAWSSISGANSKDYLPLPLEYVVSSTPRGKTFIVQSTYNYRRIATIKYRIANNTTGVAKMESTTSYSNEINIKSGRYFEPETLIAYPNPASSTLYIENKGTDYTLANTKVNIANTIGTVVNSNNFSVINPNLISIDVSNLFIGTYFINIETGVVPRGNKQITFIKSN